MTSTNFFERIDAYWFAPMPRERLAALRIISGSFALIYLLVRGGHLTSYASFDTSAFDPVGVVSCLGAPLSSGLVYTSYGITVLSGFAFVAGAGYRLAGPVFAAGFLWVTSYRNSWGMIYHQDNLIALHLLLLALAPAHHAWAVDTPRSVLSEPHGRYGWAVRAMCWVTVTSYVLAGLAKLEGAGLAWSDGEILRTHVAYDAVRKLELGGVHSPIGALLVPYRWPFTILGPATLLLEIGAPLALVNRRLAWAWTLGVWCFHFGVIVLMAITFAYPVSGAAFVSFFAAERLLLGARARLFAWVRPKPKLDAEP